MTGLVGVTSSASDFYLVRTNAYGDTIWTKTYDKSQQDVGQAVVQTKDGGFAVAGYVYDGQEYIYLIRTDSFGDTLWTKKYNFYPGQVPFSLKQTNDDGFLIVGNALDNSFYRYTYAIKTDATGDTLWTRVFDISSNCLGFYTCQTSDNGYIIGGISIMFPAGAYIIKTDSMGIVNSTSGIFEEMSFLFFQCYPNPSNGIFSVYTKGNYENNSILEIYNLSGQCIYQCSITNNVINTVDIRFLQCGIYFATLKSKKFLKTFKLILDK